MMNKYFVIRFLWVTTMAIFFEVWLQATCNHWTVTPFWQTNFYVVWFIVFMAAPFVFTYSDDDR